MTVNSAVRLALGAAILTPAFAADTPTPNRASSVLWYEQPARSWMTEALPLGGGSLGGMFFGLTETERVQFNHNTLWTGNEKDTGKYQAFGDLFIRLGHANPQNYRRELDLERSTLKVSYQSNGVRYERTAFASHPAGVIVYQLSADKPGSYTGRLWLTDMHNARIEGNGTSLTATGRLGKDGMSYQSEVRVFANGGKVRLESAAPAGNENPLAGVPDIKDIKLPEASLVFEGCTSLTIVLAADTDYSPDRGKNWRGEAPQAKVDRRLDAVTPQTLPAVYQAHLADYQNLYRRWKLDVGTTAKELAGKPTDQRLLAYNQQKTNDPDLEELLANYGRYLLISRSREGGLPANLQGLWNDSNIPKWL